MTIRDCLPALQMVHISSAQLQLLLIEGYVTEFHGPIAEVVASKGSTTALFGKFPGSCGFDMLNIEFIRATICKLE